MVLLCCGIFSYILGKFGFPAVPIVLGLILGPIAEANLQRSLVMSDGSWTIFITRPISVTFIVLTVLILVVLKMQNKKMVSKKEVEEEYEKIVNAAKVAQKLKLEVFAGHGLDYHNVRSIVEIPEIVEVNIGHSIVSRAVLVGMERAVREMKMAMSGLL